MAEKRAFVYGITGQDGRFLLDFLLAKGYEVGGAASGNAEGLAGKAKIYQIDLKGGGEEATACLDEFAPDEVYNLAGISAFRAVSEDPAGTFSVNATATVKMLAKMRGSFPKARFFQASSGKIFSGCGGRVDENSRPMPTNAYEISKLSAQMMVSLFREGGLHASSGILFNHESPLRTEEFVTRKITKAAAEISLGKKKGPLLLGNLDSVCDWGYAGDYVEAMWLMLQQEKPDDYVIATGEPHTVEEFCEAAFAHAGLDWKACVKTDPGYLRPSEVDMLCGDASKARQKLGWKPKVAFENLVKMMVDADLKA